MSVKAVLQIKEIQKKWIHVYHAKLFQVILEEKH